MGRGGRAYAKRPFVRPVLALGVTLVGRLRKDSALRDLPPREKRTAQKRRGRKRKYGKNRISLAKRAAHRQGWQDVLCLVYGVCVLKRVKTFLATHPTFGGVIRVVIVKEASGPQFFYCTHPAASVQEIIETKSELRECIGSQEEAQRTARPIRRREGLVTYGTMAFFALARALRLGADWPSALRAPARTACRFQSGSMSCEFQ